MAGRRLGAEERALWRRVTDSVRPLDGRAGEAPPSEEPTVVRSSRTPSRDVARPVSTALDTNGKRTQAPKPGETLDGGWDRRLRRGLVSPERTIDLHGHTLASAHAALDQGLDRAIADDVRMLLLVTGRPPRAGAAAPRRGAIRASISDWLAGSRHASRIAAVRNAHPRHGGAGALYIILRRRKMPGSERS
jgi:DNA-nicking Smr family endonuclease